MTTIPRLVQSISLLLMLMLMGTGCDVPSALVGKIMPGETLRPKYTGLAGESIGVMVWTDRGVQVDYPTLNLDLASSIQNKLMAAAKNDEMKGTIFPVQPASIVRYQMEHPMIDMKNVADVAPQLGVTRLIYIEVNDFGTRAAASVELFRGSMITTLKVVESHGEKGHVAYEEDNIHAIFPPKVADDGTPDGDDVRFYAGTVDAMSTEIFNRLVSHESPDF
jgi:hypothetical protein